MIRIIDIQKDGTDDILTRNIQVESGVEATVTEIIHRVADDGDRALFEFSKKFDQATLTDLRVSEEEIDDAVRTQEPAFLETLRLAAENIREFHSKQVKEGFEFKRENGVVLGQKVLPLDRVGIYVPGGTAAYPSTVLMNAIPAKIAGVHEIVMVTPPDKNGRIPSSILAAARVAGVNRIFRIGGAQAIAALALGTESVPKVDKIVGPGNVYVATAKRLLFGTVDIDMIAGPSEILVLADQRTDPALAAADLLSQAEHDKLASAVLVTTSIQLALAVSDELEKQIPQLPRAEIARASIDRNGRIVVAATMDEAIELANRIAPEHLEISTDNPFEILPRIRNAGSVFLGRNVPEALGDYFAGTNHTLPTSGTARFSSPLSVDDFVKRMSYIYYTDEALRADGPHVVRFARQEGLDAHAESVARRLRLMEES